jgi:hypothetical protein
MILPIREMKRHGLKYRRRNRNTMELGNIGPNLMPNNSP